MRVIMTLVSTLVMVAIFTPGIAEDRLTLSGSLEVRGYIYSVDRESKEKTDSSSALTAASASREEALEATVIGESTEVKSKPRQTNKK